MPADSTSAERFRENVARLLESRGITITRMAHSLGMSRPGISRILHGHEDVTFSRAERIASFFELDLADLLRRPRKGRKSA